MTDMKAIVLAAGKGTRLQTEGADLPKVMRQALGRPLIQYVLDGIRFIGEENIILVVGYQKEKVLAAFPQNPFAVQTEQLGTGHAVLSAGEALEGYTGSVLVCCGDMPLLRSETYEALVQTHIEGQNTCTILTGTSDLQLPYGRVIRDATGGFSEVVEEKDCTPEQLAIRELNSGVYVFAAEALLPALFQLKSDNAQGEYYLTDVPAILKAEGAKIGICKRELGNEIIGVNTLEQLMEVEEILRRRES